ncbi:hypothetical protein JOC62_002630 [Clostridium sardiniense]|nr:hypothetical protein [Clostridium sardiniense]
MDSFSTEINLAIFSIYNLAIILLLILNPAYYITI